MPTVIKNTIHDRMLQLPELLISRGIIRYRQEFLDDIELRKENFRQIKLGVCSFTIPQVEKACRVYKVNANWLTGVEKNIFRT